MGLMQAMKQAMDWPRHRQHMPVISPQLAIALRSMTAPRAVRLLTLRRKAYQQPRL
jgi:hypothetical protein